MLVTLQEPNLELVIVTHLAYQDHLVELTINHILRPMDSEIAAQKLNFSKLMLTDNKQAPTDVQFLAILIAKELDAMMSATKKDA